MQNNTHTSVMLKVISKSWKTDEFHVTHIKKKKNEAANVMTGFVYTFYITPAVSKVKQEL